VKGGTVFGVCVAETRYHSHPRSLHETIVHNSKNTYISCSQINLAKKSAEGAATSALVGIAAGAVGLVMGTGFGFYLKGKLSASG